MNRYMTKVGVLSLVLGSVAITEAHAGASLKEIFQGKKAEPSLEIKLAQTVQRIKTLEDEFKAMEAGPKTAEAQAKLEEKRLEVLEAVTQMKVLQAQIQEKAAKPDVTEPGASEDRREATPAAPSAAEASRGAPPQAESLNAQPAPVGAAEGSSEGAAQSA